MSEAALQERRRKQGWAAPGGFHDFLVGVLKVALPATIGVLIAFLALAPLQKGKEISFILDKSKVDVTRERLRVETARYRGQDERGRPFTLDASSAVQVSAADPVVQLSGVEARILLEDGPASVQARQGRYDMDKEQVDVVGQILFSAADGYKLRTRDVAVNLNDRVMTSRGRVDGTMPLGRFSADRMMVDLPDRRVVLTGRARLHIVQGGLR
jgi:lipopolysaccharide export system protein LptC